MKERGNFWLRTLDRGAGIPLLFLLSLFKKRRRKPAAIKSVLVIKLGTIGDTLLLAPVLKAVKDSGASLTVVGSGNNRAVLRQYPFLDALETFEISRAVKNPAYFIRFMGGLNTRRYDLVIDFEPWARISALLAFFVKTGCRAGFRTGGEARHFAFDISAAHRNDLHESENYRALAALSGITAGKAAVPFPVSAEDRAFVDGFLKKKGIPPERLVLFHPWSSGFKGRFKEWGGPNFSALARLLIREGYLIGITGTKENSEGAAEITGTDPERVFSFCGELTLGQVASLLRKTPLLVSVNTGIMHLGAVMGATVISLNGPAGALRWGPRGPGRTFEFESSRECAPCLNLGFEYGCRDGGCMDDIRVEDVFKKAVEMMSVERRGDANA